jgi:phage/plasmid primase-like uncharacterized protein
MFLDAKELKSEAYGKWAGIFAQKSPALAAALSAKAGRHVPCPVHGGVDGFRLFKDWEETGGGICNTCGSHRDGFSLLSWVNGWSFRETLQAVADSLGIKQETNDRAAPKPRSKPAAPKVDLQAQRQESMAARSRLSSVYLGAMPLDAPGAEPARAYLRGRGLPHWPPMLRMHPGLRWSGPNGETQGPFPTLLSLVCDVQGRGVTLHRTYLSEDGRKAPVQEPKKLMSRPADMSMRGASIQLCEPAGELLGVAEGLETAIAVMLATGIPCWAAISSTLLPHFRPPPGVRRVLVFADKDKPTQHHPEGVGLEAARALVEALGEAGIPASIQLPKSDIPDGAKSVDWLDEFVNVGSPAFAEAVAASRA